MFVFTLSNFFLCFTCSFFFCYFCFLYCCMTFVINTKTVVICYLTGCYKHIWTFSPSFFLLPCCSICGCVYTKLARLVKDWGLDHTESNLFILFFIFVVWFIQLLHFYYDKNKKRINNNGILANIYLSEPEYFCNQISFKVLALFMVDPGVFAISKKSSHI